VLLHQVRDFSQRCFRLRRHHLTRHCAVITSRRAPPREVRGATFST
jgi:hypothetical protein